MRKAVLATSVLFVLTVLTSAGLSGDDKTNPDKKPEPKPLVGQSAFEFSLQTIDGKSVKLADMKGKVVLIDFWETWCPPCQALMPHIIGFHDKYKDKGLQVVGMNRGNRDKDIKPVVEFAAKRKMEFPVIHLSGDDHTEIIDRYQVNKGIPYLVVLDRTGVVRFARAGGGTGMAQLLDQTIQKLLAE